VGAGLERLLAPVETFTIWSAIVYRISSMSIVDVYVYRYRYVIIAIVDRIVYRLISIVYRLAYNRLVSVSGIRSMAIVYVLSVVAPCHRLLDI